MLVYAIESLSQKHDGYSATWEDFDDDVRTKLESAFLGLKIEQQEQIKSALISGKQFRLRKRFESFVEKHLDDSFFAQHLGKDALTLRKGLLRRCFFNLYQLRSSFVHELKPIDVMLSRPHSAQSDYLLRFGEPYLTFTGLNRVIRAIVINFASHNHSDKVEKINWTHETSSVIFAEFDSSCWIQNPDGFAEDRANKWFTAYLSELERSSVTNQSEIMDKITKIFDSAKGINKKPILHYYWLYNAIHTKKEEAGWIEFIRKREVNVGGCIHYYTVLTHLYGKLIEHTDKGSKPVDLDEFDLVVSQYNSSRFHKNGLLLPYRTESALYCCAANVALECQDESRYKNYITMALCESASDFAFQEKIRNAMANRQKIDVADLLYGKKPEEDCSSKPETEEGIAQNFIAAEK